MRLALTLTALTVLTACSTPTSEPPTHSSSTTPVTSSEPTTMLPAWEKRLPAKSPRVACPTEATFQPACLQAILALQDVVDEVDAQAERLGSRYAPVKKATEDVAKAIAEWVDTCATSTAGSSVRVRCVTGTLGRILRGDEAILSAIRAVEA